MKGVALKRVVPLVNVFISDNPDEVVIEEVDEEAVLDEEVPEAALGNDNGLLLLPPFLNVQQPREVQPPRGASKATLMKTTVYTIAKVINNLFQMFFVVCASLHSELLKGSRGVDVVVAGAVAGDVAEGVAEAQAVLMVSNRALKIGRCDISLTRM